MRKYFLYLLIFVFVSCGKGGKPFEGRINKVFGENVFRGLTIGDSYNKVLKTENREFMQFPDSNLIKYMYHVSDTEEYHWVYIFEEDKIKEIQFDAYLGEPSDGKKYVSLVQKRYDKILGKSSSNDGIITWKSDSLLATLYDESEAALMGKVRFSLMHSNAKPSVHKADFIIYQDE